ncbi:LytTR family transcriptional regulator [Pedobacter chinensis]|uniref:LytTR family transcriptional regulator n=1 Tax=Pedobacter chinensis TaxID=2282421 RepID=A0A369PX47_9SPHI|nr:LytTR family DNA-binding domain-containing protein [Pedobacter chinensis]RDC55249.1 LytTR family transcriptional regulator [Pedobacter chinensis]
MKNNLTTQHIYSIFQNKQKRNAVVLTCFSLIVATITLDFLYSQFQNSSFYISESLLFSSFWTLFIPLLHIQSMLTKRSKKLSYNLMIAGVATVIHLLAYPALVWVLSKSFYYHTFSYWQTFEYGLTAYFIKLIIIYGFSFFMLAGFKNKLPNRSTIIEEKKVQKPSFITSIIVSDGNNKKAVIDTNDISCFSASSPYIVVHHQSKKYLHTETLKSLEAQLDNNQFIRIHKSLIVNLFKVTSYQSRQNGDYDLMLSDNTVLRVSRNYAKGFKSKFMEIHPLTTK